MPSLKRSVDATRLLLDLVTRDPGFVRGGELGSDEIPVFTFHSLEPQSFERKMLYLKDAGYHGIGHAEYLDALMGRRAAAPKSVLLTIDDGRASTWTVAYPILKRLGLRATAFLVTSAVHDSDEVSKTISEVERDGWPALVGRDDSVDRPFVTWGEVRAMRDVIDIESHTHLHALVPISADTAGVMVEAMRKGYGEFDCPFVWIEGRQVRGREVPPGAALPRCAPRLAGLPAYRSIDRRFETEAEMKDAIRFDLAEARRLLKEKAGADANSLCYPWHVDSRLAREIASEAGYVAAFAGKASSAPAISGRGSDPFAIARVGEDYVERLPGPKRRSLLSVLREKAQRG